MSVETNNPAPQDAVLHHKSPEEFAQQVDRIALRIGERAMSLDGGKRVIDEAYQRTRMDMYHNGDMLTVSHGAPNVGHLLQADRVANADGTSLNGTSLTKMVRNKTIIPDDQDNQGRLQTTDTHLELSTRGGSLKGYVREQSGSSEQARQRSIVQRTSISQEQSSKAAVKILEKMRSETSKRIASEKKEKAAKTNKLLKDVLEA